MTDDRPDAEVLRRAMFDNHHRLVPRARRYVTADVRCPRRRHLLAVVVGTPHGRWAAWREPWVERTPSGGWECAWSDEAWPVTVVCSCDRGKNSWLLDMPWLAGQVGTWSPDDVPRPHEPDVGDGRSAARFLS